MSVPTFGQFPGDVPEPVPPTTDSPFRVAVFGDFSGRAARGDRGDRDELLSRKPRRVNRESFDAVLAKLAPTVEIDLPTGKEAVTFEQLDDFHPDQLIPKLERFDDQSSKRAKAEHLRGVLHDPGFQTLERNWRGVYSLVRKFGDDAPVEVRLFDWTPAELTADLTEGEDVTETAFYQTLSQTAESDGPWGLFVGLTHYKVNAADADQLGRIARVCRALFTPYLASFDPSHLPSGYTKPAGDDAAAWNALREMPASALIGLAGPDPLMRLPFGGDTSGIDAMEFEEFTDGQRAYLWGHAGLAVASLLTQSFVASGWGFKPGAHSDLDGLPLHVFTDEDGDKAATVAAASLATADSQRLGKLGLMTFLSIRNRDAVQLSKVRPLELSTPKLSGRWELGTGVAKKASGKAGVSAAVGFDASMTGANAPKDKGDSGWVSGESFGERPPSSKPANDGWVTGSSFAESNPGGGGYSSDSDLDPNKQLYLELLRNPPKPQPAEGAGGGDDDSGKAASGGGDDLDLDSLLADTGGGSAPAAGGDDLDLDAMLAGLDAPAEAPAASAGDDDLDAMLAALDAPAAEPAAEEPPADDLDALLASLGGDEEPKADEPSLDDLLAELGG